MTPPQPHQRVELDEGLTLVRSSQHHRPAIRYPINSSRRMEELPAMFQPFRLSDTDHLVHDRIHELHEVAAGLRATQHASRADGGFANVVVRARAFIGRRLMSLGSTVAGQHA